MSRQLDYYYRNRLAVLKAAAQRYRTLPGYRERSLARNAMYYVTKNNNPPPEPPASDSDDSEDEDIIIQVRFPKASFTILFND